MNMKHALQSILVVALLGVAFSGALVYREYASQAAACTPFAQPGTIFGYPPCVYGLIMYTLVLALTVWGLATRH